MEKKELKKIEIKRASLEDVSFVNRVSAAHYFVLAEDYDIEDVKTLVLNFYYGKLLSSGDLMPMFRVFFSEGEYISQCFGHDEGWKKGRIYTLLSLFCQNEDGWWSYVSNWEKYTVSLNEATEQLLEYYFNGVWIKRLEKQGIYHSVNNFQETILAKHKKARHQKEKNEIDQKMSEIGEVPKDFFKWCDETALFQSRYIYYKKRNGDKQVQGYCTCCHKDVLVTAPRHNEYGACPNCCKKIQYKVEGRSKFILDHQNVVLLQVVNNGFCVRYFQITKKYNSDYKNPEICYFEMIRKFYYEEKEVSYIWGSFKQTGELRWCKDVQFYHLTKTMIYLDNIEESLKDTKWKYCALKEFAKSEGVVNVSNYLHTYVKHPYIEKLVKVGLIQLTKDILSNHHTDIVKCYNYCYKKSITGLLGITKKELKMFRELDISANELMLFQKAKSLHMVMNKEQIGGLISYTYFYANEVLQHLKYTTFNKLDQYLKAQCITDGLQLTTAWILWRDLIEMSNKLEIDLKNTFNLFPKHLKYSHDFVANRWKIKIKKIEAKEERALDRKAKKLFEKLRPNYEWENKDYAILVPKDRQDFIQEGEKLHICVGINGYFQKMVKGTTIILFLRKKAEVNKPFYTLELNGKTIIQCQAFGHKQPTEEIQKVLDQYLKEKIVIQKSENIA